MESATILAHFRRRIGNGATRDLHNTAYHLMRIILEERHCSDLDSLIDLCQHPDTLRCYLPSEADRIVFAGGLVEALNELRSGESEVGAAVTVHGVAGGVPSPVGTERE